MDQAAEAGIPTEENPGMDVRPQAPLQRLTRERCIELLRGHNSYGRIGYVVEGLAIIVPINFVVDGESIVFTTTKGTKLSWLGIRSRIAFQVDHGSPTDRAGWSVLVHGTAREVTEPAELAALRRGPLHSWAVPSAEHWVRISIDEISGRQIGPDDPDESAVAEPED